jgi:orotidine-5'-phosphate decarboxylase
VSVRMYPREPSRIYWQRRVAFALDMDGAAAVEWIARLGSIVRVFKVGLELFTDPLAGQVLDALRAGGHDVFLDLKLHDIPATVQRAVRSIARRGVRYTTVHASVPVMRAAVAGAREAAQDGHAISVLAVTVLTSMAEADLRVDGYAEGTTPAALVSLRAQQAVDLGCSGVVTSPLEVAALRPLCPPEFLLVVPGIRPGSYTVGDDQRRTATPETAIADGADLLVVGRPIRDAADPLAVARDVTAVVIRDVGRGDIGDP